METVNLKINDLKVGDLETLPLLVKSATARKTKAGKPYLALEFFDGSDSISGNYWDWAGANIPSKNSVLDVTAQVTEWQGNKQLNVKRMTTNSTVPVSDFAPVSDYDIKQIYVDACKLMQGVTDDFLKALALSCLTSFKDKWLEIPGARSVHHAFKAGTLVHSYSVACLSKALAENIKGANVDLCTVGGMLHDFGKLFTYCFKGATIDMTNSGMLYDHIFIGAEMIGTHAYDSKLMTFNNAAAKLAMLRHIILSHHGKREHGAVVVPLSMEAHIVHYADAVDADTEQIREQSAKCGTAMWTDKIWALDNQPHLSTQYVQSTMMPQSENKK